MSTESSPEGGAVPPTGAEQSQPYVSKPHDNGPGTAPGRVLSTLNEDGTRRRAYPELAKGHYYWRRLVVAWGLIAMFVGLPFVHVDGKPAVLLDVLHRRFTFFGSTFLPTDTVLLMLFMITTFLSIFLLTALFGRVWCGWGCPQTVYMEFVFRPIERLFEGNRKRQQELDDKGGWPLNRIAKYLTFAVLSFLVANVFLAWFVGVETLSTWVTQSPAVHPAGFAIVGVTSVLMFIDFAWFREQMCVVACPYARIQSALLDRNSLIVAYDVKRGEPRGKLSKVKVGDLSIGDCIDCKACVYTCPTNIDIREGLQMECISCTQCVDACDAVMDKIKKPRGLIRYTSQERLATGVGKLVRVRVLLYPIAILIAGSALVYLAGHRAPAEVTVLRGIGAPFTEDADGTVTNQLRLKIHNRGTETRKYQISVPDAGELQWVAPQNPFEVQPDHALTSPLMVVSKRGAIAAERMITVHVDDGHGFATDVPFRLLGPGAKIPTTGGTK